VKSKGSRHERRATQRALDRARGNVVLLKMRPSLFFAVREAAKECGLSMPVYILAVLMQDHTDLDIFDQSTEEIKRRVRG
jgi:hypothetical protein